MDISQFDRELSEVNSKLIMREMELAKLMENNKQLIKQLHDKKPREVVSQVMFH